MTVQTVREMLGRRAFQPVEGGLSSGQSYEIRLSTVGDVPGRAPVAATLWNPRVFRRARTRIGAVDTVRIHADYGDAWSGLYVCATERWKLIRWVQSVGCDHSPVLRTRGKRPC